MVSLSIYYSLASAMLAAAAPQMKRHRPPANMASSPATPQEAPQLVNGQDAPADLGLYLDMQSAKRPEAVRGDYGAAGDTGPRTLSYERLNPDLFAPPGTDKGSLPNAVWPLGLSHNRPGAAGRAGWARQQNTAVLPIAKRMAGVDMKLAPNAYRELHWHTAGEWALILEGCVHIAAVDDEGGAFADDVCAGDVWFFPAGVPHSIQAGEQGVEFLLVFDEGDFDENGTFLVSGMFARTPRSVLSKNFRADVDAFEKLPDPKDLYIFNGTPQPKGQDSVADAAPGGRLTGSKAYSYHWSQQEPMRVPGGSVKVLDPRTFPIASMFSAALVTIEPGAMREMHWHTTSDEWDYFLKGSARATIYKAPDSANTFDFTAGDVGYIPQAAAHYVENTGTEDLVFLEVLQAPKFSDISVAQWLALTPKQAVKDHLHLPDDVIDNLPKQKTLLKTGNTNLTALAGGGKAY
ncbi:oxalate decarboxylase [Ophiocordyceps camponoti-floridani]|uniref:Oxalate decarboxylase n=1 Tax=Ophiocordyceps camponoti-floridani TaxID=2030778 RepID=A0A8H4Q7P1_9HYPO|nr:oxalate decarboxylase [Ophiocordyceps camponoti-floridani]